MDWLMTPEIQTDPHHWWATFGGHALIGCVVWAAMVAGKADRMISAITILLIYWVWEAEQVLDHGGDPFDSLVDWLAVASGVCLAWGLWSRKASIIGAVIALMALAGFVGAADAKRRKWGGGK